MKDIRVLIGCGGVANRWNNHLNTPKWLVPVDNNEPLVHRTIRQANAEKVKEVVVVGYPLETKPHGAVCVEALGTLLEGTCIGGCSAHMKPNDNHLILVGDGRFSDMAMKRMTEVKAVWSWFGREAIDSSHGPEIMGVQIPAGWMVEFFLAMAKSWAIRPGDGVSRGWATYRHMEGFDPKTHRLGPHWIELDKTCLDFDKPEEYSAWIKAYEKETHAV